MKRLYTIIICIVSLSSYSQDLFMQQGTFNRCQPDIFYDSGGPSGNYSSDETIVTTICAQNPGDFISLNFTAFSTQLNVDVLTIYDGDDTTAPVIGTYSGVAGPGLVVASESNASGCITLEFVSNATGTTTGWEAIITCQEQCQDITTSIASDPMVNGSGVIEIPPGTLVNFTGSATFSEDATGATYNWNFGDSNTATGTSVSNTYNNPGTYNVSFTVTDTNPTGCSETSTVIVIVLEAIVTINNPAYPESAYDLQELIENKFVTGGCSTVDNFSFQVSGTPNAFQTKSYGYFTRGGAVGFPFEEGIVLSTGRAYEGGNQDDGPGTTASTNLGLSGDPDLEAFFLPSDSNFDSNDATFVKFNFVPTGPLIEFNYIMFSEEYDGSTECSFADAFAFLYREVGAPAYQNVAVLPDGTPVSVTNINNSGTCTDNPQYFEGYELGDTNYGGRTQVLTAVLNVIPNTTYEIKLVVADEGDSIWDSAIFLEAGGFDLGGELGDDITIAAGTAECEGETITLDTNAPLFQHTWFKDGVEIPGETSSTLDITEGGMYSVNVVFAAGCETSDSIQVEFKPVPIANPAPNLNLCSISSTGEFNLDDNDTIILGSQEPLDFIISYHLSQADADTNSNALTSPYTNVSNPQTIFARIADVTQECYDTTSFELTLEALTINTVTPLQVCDDDTDGFVAFDLSLKNDEVIGTIDSSTVTVTYHATQNDADMDANPLPIPYTNTVPDLQTIFIRLEINSNPDCYNTTLLDLEVISNPIANTVSPLEVCDDDSDGFSSFDLTLRDLEAIGVQTGMVVTYHETQSDANNGINNLTSPYSNIVANVQTVYVRIESGTTGCYDTTELLLLVNPIPTLNSVTDYVLCDDDMPGDQTELFTLTSKDAEVSNGQPVIVSYYPTLVDAQMGTNAHISPYANVGNPETVYYTLTHTTTGCVNIGSFDLIVNPLPQIVNPTPLEVCDDGVPDGLTAIDLTLKNQEVTGGNPGYSVSYHLTQGDADSGASPLPVPYVNTSNGQVVIVRVEDIATGCYATVPLTLVVEQAPVASTPGALEYCDPDSDGFGVFTLTDLDVAITSGDPTLTVSYHETMADADNNVNALSSPYNNIVEGQQVVYARVESGTIATDCATLIEVLLVVNPTPQIEDPTPLEVCDDVSADGFAQFDLTQKDAEILDGLDPVQYAVSYHVLEADAGQGTNAIAVPTSYTNTTAFMQTLWVRVEDTSNGCHKLTTLDLVVNALPVLVQPAPLELCDDVSGDEVEAFVFDLAEAEMLNGQTGISFTYHETQLDADNGTNPITSPYMNVSNPQTVFVRATDDQTGCSVSTTATILLRVNPLPSPAEPTDLEVCDLDNDGFESFDLEDRTLEIINGELDVAVTYHETLEDANNGINALSSPYTNIVMDEQTIYVRAESTVTGCYNTTVTLTVRVLPSPEVPVDIEDYVICDTNGDGLAQFDLTAKGPEILGGQSPSDYTLTYHLTGADALSGANPIVNVTNYTNVGNPQTIYIRLEGDANGCVTSTGFFDLVVELPPEAVQPSPLELCDDTLADELTVFDLTVKDQEITGGEASWSVSYYETLSDAQSQVDAVDAGSYTNTSVNGAPSNPQTLYVVVTDVDTGCVDYTTLTIRVLPNPTPTDSGLLPDLELCDDTNPGDMEEEFDLTLNELLILNGETGVTPTYHESFADAELGANAIASPGAYLNLSAVQTVYVRVTNDVTGCYTIVDFDIIVNPLPDAVAVTDLIECELNNDGFFDFDLTQKDAEVLGGQDPSLFTVTYHVSQADADNLSNALVSPYTNLSNPQQIFVAITNNDTGCSISTPVFNIELHEAAVANALPEPVRICDDEMDDDGDLGNNSAQFDLTPVTDLADLDPGSVQAQVLGGQDPADYIVSYYATLTDAELGVNPLPFLYENVSNPQVIYVRVDNDTMVDDGTGNMVDSSICYSVAPLTLMVDPLPVFGLDDGYVLCVGTNGTEVLGVPVLDTGLSGPAYGFEWFLEGVPLSGATSGSYTPLEGGLYTVVVTDSQTGCHSQDSAQVVESSPPIDIYVDVLTDAFSDLHVIEVTVLDPLDMGDYEFSLDGGAWQGSNVFADVPAGGHQVTVRDRTGCGYAFGEVTVMDYPAYFTPNGDGYNDTWNIKGIAGQPGATIYIFDRYGKLLKQISPTGDGWDGTYNGSPMPTSDYWFVVEYSEPNTGDRKEFKAHFTLKR